MRSEMENLQMNRDSLDNSLTEATESVYLLPDEEENVTFSQPAFSRSLSPRKILRERKSMPSISSQQQFGANHKLMEMSNKLQAKVRKLSEQLLSISTTKSSQSKSVQVGLSAKHELADIERQRNAMVISKATLNKSSSKAKSQEQARIQVKPRRLVRNFNVKTDMYTK